MKFVTPSTYKYIILESPADKSRVDIAYAPPWVSETYVYGTTNRHGRQFVIDAWYKLRGRLLCSKDGTS